MVFITDSFFDKATIDVVKYKQKRGGNMYIVKVLVEHAIYKLDTTYDYLSKYQVLAGCRVHIRFGYQQLVGYVVECQETLFTQKQLEEKIIKVIPKDIVMSLIKNHYLIKNYKNLQTIFQNKRFLQESVVYNVCYHLN